MPFRPLPGPFLDEVGAVASRPHVAVDLGCGDGALGRLLTGTGLALVGLDLVAEPGALRPLVVGDALRPPLLPGSCDLVLAANLVRHLAPRHRDLGFLSGWLRLLRPGGALYVFEDAPRRAGGPAGHYGRLQDLLARLVPDQRGPLLDLGRFSARARRLGAVVASGTFTNSQPLDADAVLALLARGRPRPGDDVDTLMKAIAADGLACGPAWWARLGRETS
ncbi:MAG TPA: class I SAM-dependent methyltransferase [Candidatus Krumholzibacteria bacterium]|nr:class I SAM-dependent methyltransferase [Candidatus Krumholzibacteria bacterium]